MTRHVAFLRAINVGGHNVKMEVLRGLFEELGLTGVESLLASGNLVFEAAEAGDELRRRIEEHLEQALGYPVATFLRSDAEVARIVRFAPFSEDELDTAKALNVGLLHRPLDAAGRRALAGLETDVDQLRSAGREVYWRCRRKQSESLFSNALLERKLKVSATFRGRKTLERLVAKYPPS